MRFKFEKLIIWQDAMKMGEEMNLLAGEFPKKEIYNLSSQNKKGSRFNCIKYLRRLYSTIETWV